MCGSRLAPIADGPPASPPAGVPAVSPLCHGGTRLLASAALVLHAEVVSSDSVSVGLVGAPVEFVHWDLSSPLLPEASKAGCSERGWAQTRRCSSGRHGGLGSAQAGPGTALCEAAAARRLGKAHAPHGRCCRGRWPPPGPSGVAMPVLMEGPPLVKQVQHL